MMRESNRTEPMMLSRFKSWGRPALLAACAALALPLLAGCAKRPPASDPEALAEFQETNDPFEPTNRVIYAFNNGLDTVVLRPAAQVYRAVVPNFVRRPVHNALTNLSSPVLLANDMAQGHPRRAGDTFMRFLINSTAGVAGLFDVAAGWGYPAHETDFGMTLALWGIPEGPFLFLPVFGPSNPRDGIGRGGDTVLDPFTYLTFGGSQTFGTTRFIVGGVDTRERVLDEVDSIKRTSLDPYATFRSLYRQNRASEIDKDRQDSARTVPAWFRR